MNSKNSTWSDQFMSIITAHGFRIAEIALLVARRTHVCMHHPRIRDSGFDSHAVELLGWNNRHESFGNY